MRVIFTFRKNVKHRRIKPLGNYEIAIFHLVQSASPSKRWVFWLIPSIVLLKEVENRWENSYGWGEDLFRLKIQHAKWNIRMKLSAIYLQPSACIRYKRRSGVRSVNHKPFKISTSLITNQWNQTFVIKIEQCMQSRVESINQIR